MVLNSLEIDPKRTWKGAWRWYSTDLLQACSSANQIQARGITFAEFACLAKTHCQVTQHKPSTTSYSQFLTHLAETTSQADSHLVVSFSRQTLGQTTLTAKTGFATIGGYNPLKKKALLMDSSRAEYPCVWVDTGLLYHAMAKIDPLLGSERGYFLLAQGEQLETSCTCPNKNRLSWTIHSPYIYIFYTPNPFVSYSTLFHLYYSLLV